MGYLVAILSIRDLLPQRVESASESLSCFDKRAIIVYVLQVASSDSSFLTGPEAYLHNPVYSNR